MDFRRDATLEETQQEDSQNICEEYNVTFDTAIICNTSYEGVRKSDGETESIIGK